MGVELVKLVECGGGFRLMEFFAQFAFLVCVCLIVALLRCRVLTAQLRALGRRLNKNLHPHFLDA